MPYLMTFNESMKAIRVSDNTILSMPTSHGAVEVQVHKSKYRDQAASLTSVPHNSQNLAALGLPSVQTPSGIHSEWIIPPFALLKSAFTKGGPFVRLGNLTPASSWNERTTNILRDSSPIYRPDLCAFVPREFTGSIPTGTPDAAIDKAQWTLKMWIKSVSTRSADANERKLLSVPWTLYSVGHLDLWLEQYRCYHLGLPLPTELSYPEEDISFNQPLIANTDTGLRTRTIELDESNSQLAGQHSMTVNSVIDSPLEQAITATGMDANGYIWEGLLSHWAQQHHGNLTIDASAENSTITGDRKIITELRHWLTKLATNSDAVAEAIKNAQADGIEFDN